MKILVLNLPYSRKIIRKFSCSYHANGFLYPPVELLRLATILKNNLDNNSSVVFLDAIAEGYSTKKCLNYLSKSDPDFIFCLASVDFINFEYKFLEEIKLLTNSKIVFIGYLPSLFPDDYPLVDIILGSNFETVVSNSLKNVNNPFSADNFLNSMVEIRESKPEFSPDEIVKIDKTFDKDGLYSELFAQGKTAYTYFSFGCPFKCSFCIKTYNLDKVYFRNLENIFSELKEFYKNGVKNIRILDDNCTLNKRLLKDILSFQDSEKMKFNYFGLSRVDLLDDEIIDLLIKLNFKHIMIGIETIKKETQCAYNKEFDLNIDKLKMKFSKMVKNSIELSFFILFNPLTESKRDLKQTLVFLKKLPIHFASLAYMTPYPGTKYFNDNREYIDFTTNPYQSLLKSKYYKGMMSNEIWFMFSFYVLKPRNFLRFLRSIINTPLSIFKVISSLLRYTLHRNETRENYF